MKKLVLWGRGKVYGIFLENKVDLWALKEDNKKRSTVGLGKYSTPKKS